MNTNQSTRLSEEGFLSDEIAAVVDAVRTRYGSWSSELRILNRVLVQAQYGLTIHVQSAQEVVCAALFMRALAHSQAAVLLIERGMTASARAMARCAMESLFNLGACAREPARALAFADADEVDRLRRAKYLTAVKDPQARETAAKADLAKVLADTQTRIAELGAHEIKVRDMAKAADLEDLYLTAYAFLSGAVHSSARDIDQHFEIDDAGNLRALINEPVLEELHKLYLMVGEIMVASGRSLAEVFGFNTAECEASLERLHELWKNLNGRGHR